MKINISKDSLLKGVHTVQNVVSSKSTLPILSNILLETMEGKLRLAATDLDIGISCFNPAEILEEGAITVPAKRFADIVKELPDAPITIHARKNNMVTIESAKSFFKLMGLPKDAFPKLPEFNSEAPLVVGQNLLKSMLDMTAFAMSRDETRYVLNGLLFSIKGKTLKLVATDGRRLALIEKEINPPKDIEREMIVPTKAIQELTRILDDEGDIKITFTDNQVCFELEDTRIISRLVDGEFPNYEQVIPRESDNKILIDKENFLLATRRAALLTTPDFQAIKMELFKDKMIISKATPDVGESREEVEINHKGNELTIGFNPGYLIDVLKNIPQHDIRLELTNPESPGVIRTDDKYTYVILPMQVI